MNFMIFIKDKQAIICLFVTLLLLAADTFLYVAYVSMMHTHVSEEQSVRGSV